MHAPKPTLNPLRPADSTVTVNRCSKIAIIGISSIRSLRSTNPAAISQPPVIEKANLPHKS
jgi:hypothetical protein